MRTEQLPDGHRWWRIAHLNWDDPLDPAWAAQRGGRWNPAQSHPTLYLNQDKVTARLNLRAWIGRWPYEPEDLRNDTGPCLVAAELPRRQCVADVHSRLGVEAVGLPSTYPLKADGSPVEHRPCQAIGAVAKRQGLRGILCRSARSPDGAGRELAWFPASVRSQARRGDTLPFERWFWG